MHVKYHAESVTNSTQCWTIVTLKQTWFATALVHSAQRQSRSIHRVRVRFQQQQHVLVQQQQHVHVTLQLQYIRHQNIRHRNILKRITFAFSQHHHQKKINALKVFRTTVQFTHILHLHQIKTSVPKEAPMNQSWYTVLREHVASLTINPKHYIKLKEIYEWKCHNLTKIFWIGNI